MVGPVESRAGSVSRVFPTVNVPTFGLSGLVSKHRDLRLGKLCEDAQKHRKFPNVSARQVLLCTEQPSFFQGLGPRRSFSTMCHPRFWAACFFREGTDFTQP